MKTKLKSILAVALCAVGLAAVAAEPEAVQLWEGGPYWAEANVGTSEVEGHPEYGALYKFDDAGAAVKTLLGQEWRVPSKDDFDKLVDTSYCTTTWDSTKKGYTFTGATDGYTDKSIFLPAAGIDYGDGDGRRLAGNSGSYWSSDLDELNDNGPYSLGFFDGFFNVGSGMSSSCPMSIRAVRDAVPAASTISAKSEVGELDLTVGDRVAKDEETLVVDPAWGNVDRAYVAIDGEDNPREYPSLSIDKWYTTALTPGRYALTLTAGEVIYGANFWKIGADWVVFNSSNITENVTFEAGKTYLILGENTVESGKALTVMDGAKFEYGALAGFVGGEVDLPNRYEQKTVEGDLYQIVEKIKGSEGNPWNIGTDGKTPPQYVTAYTNGTELVIGGAGTVAALKDVDGLKDLLANLTAITITEPTVMGAADNAFDDVKNVTLTLPDGWQGELPDEDGRWYGAEYVTLMAYPLSVKNVTFQQRYPWNGLVDIGFGVTGPAGEKDVVVTVRDGEAEVTNFTAEVTIPESGVLAANLVWDATTAGLAADFKSDDVTVEVAFAGEAAVVPVQLWADGPFWATVNVGTAEPGAPSEYGALYTFDNATNEVAKLDDGWRLPTEAELKMLDGETSGYCTKTWDTTKKGYTFTGATDGYTDKSIFLPAADYNYGDGRTEAGSKGYYWSSTEDGSYNAKYLYFMENGARVNAIDRSYGLSVRAVRDTPPAPPAPVASDIAAKSAAGTVDLRTSIALAEGEATVAGVSYSDTAWGAADQAAVTLGWTNETTGASDVIQTGLEGEGKTDISLPKRNGAYRLTHSTGGLTSFVEFMVEGWPEVKIPVVTGYTYVVSNETAEVTGTLADGTNTYVVAKGSELKVYFTLDKNYQFVGTPDNPMALGAINESKVIDIASLPKAELGPISYLDWDGETMTNAVCKVYEEYTGQTTLGAGTTYVVMENKEVSTRITVNGTVESPTRLILCDGATLTAKAGVEVVIGKALVIYGQEKGTGALEATGSNYSAGIGGGFMGNGGTVTINGGAVMATGYGYAAGIGGGAGGSGGTITINGGAVTATGGVQGAGIGGGDAYNLGTGGGCGTITINGGTVTATGGQYGAGIGGGSDNVDGGAIVINGGDVTAIGIFGAEGIGRGCEGLVDCTVTFGADKDFILKIGDDAASTVYFPQAQYVTDHSAAYANIKAADVVLLKIPSPTEGFFYAVTNVTDAAGVEVIGTLEDGTYTCAFVNGDSYEVTYTLEYGYDWVTSPASNPLTGTITEDTMLPEVTVMQLGADIEFNAMGGAYSDGSEVVTNFCVLVYTMPATPTRTDYEFLGWYDSWKADAAKVEEGSVLKEYSPHSIYAKWKSTKFEPSEDEEVIKTDGNGVIVAQEVEPTGELILPEMNRGGSSGVANVEIGEDAFLKNTGITSVSLPVFVKKIGSYAFANATGISKIKFVQPRDATTGENTTLTIGDGAFSGLSLTKIELPPYVASIGAKAFAGNTKLTDLTIMGPTTIDWEARPFLNCGTATLDGKVTLHLSYEVATNKDYATKLWNYVKNYADNIVIDFNPYGTAKVLSFGSDFVEFEARIDTPWLTIDINSVKVLTTTELTGADLEKTWTTVPLTNVTPVEGNVYRATFEGQGGGTRFYQIAIVMPAEEN